MTTKSNLSGEPSEEVVSSRGMDKADKDALARAEDDVNTAPLSMSFIQRILDSEKMQKTASEQSIDVSGVNLESPRVSFSGVSSTGSIASSTADEDKDREDLLTKIQTLKLDLKQAKLDKSAEKTMSRKKDRSLVKLAKELNRRGDEIKEQKKKIEELTSSVATLEAKLAANQTELELRVTSNEKLIREHNAKVAELEDAHRKVWDEHHAKVAELQDNHIKSSEEHVEKTDRLRKEVLVSNRTIEKLRAELARVGDHKAADEIVSRGLSEPLTRSDMPLTKTERRSSYLVTLFIMVLAIGYQLDLLSLNAMCAPVRPGMALDDYFEAEAPWWAPSSVKSSAFAVCGKRPRTRLLWGIGKGGNKKLSIVSLKDEVPKTILEKQVASAVVNSGHLTTTDKKGVLVNVKSPWAL